MNWWRFFRSLNLWLLRTSKVFQSFSRKWSHILLLKSKKANFHQRLIVNTSYQLGWLYYSTSLSLATYIWYSGKALLVGTPSSSVPSWPSCYSYQPSNLASIIMLVNFRVLKLTLFTKNFIGFAGAQLKLASFWQGPSWVQTWFSLVAV